MDREYARDRLGRFARTSSTVQPLESRPSAREAWERRVAEQVRAEAQRPVNWAADPPERTTVAVKNLFTMDLGEGYRTEVRSANDRSDGSKGSRGVYITCSGHIRNKHGDGVGFFERTIQRDPVSKKLYASFEYLSINESEQGKGLAARFNREVEKRLVDTGVTRVRVDAALTVGPYAWARDKRFEYRNYSGELTKKSQAQKHVRLIQARTARNVQKGYMTEAQARMVNAEAVALFNAAERGKDVRPYHIAAVGRSVGTWVENGVTMWAGKDMLLSVPDAAWSGEKDISQPLTASAELRYAVKERLSA